MAALTGLMALAGAGQAASSISGGYAQSQAMSSQGAYQKQTEDTNARLSMMNADDALKRGEVAAGNVERQGRQVVGSERAGLAAQGIDVNSGSAAQVQASSAAVTALDAQTTRNNAWREAWGYKEQAQEATSRGKFAQAAAESGAKNTILTAGMNAATAGIKTGYAIARG